MSLSRMLSFILQHRAYFLLAPVVLFLGTFLHEHAHAAAVELQGGTVQRIHILPSFDKGYFTFGYVSYNAPDTANTDLISLAPTLLSLALAALLGLVLGLFGRPGTGPRIAMILGFILPLVDVSLAFAGLFLGNPHSDLSKVFGDRTLEVLPFALGILLVYTLLGRWAFLRSWGPDTLSFLEYAVGLLFVLSLPWTVGFAM